MSKGRFDGESNRLDGMPDGASERGVADTCSSISDSDLGRLARIGFRAAGAAHDLSNMLQVAASAIRLIERGVDPATNNALRSLFLGAFASLERANRLSRSISSLHTLSTGDSRVTSIEECLGAIAEVIALAAGPKIDVEFLLGGAVPLVLCDAAQLQDAVLNLVVNAKHAMPSGGRLSIAVSREDAPAAPAPMAVVRIADNGCGMSAELAERVFDAFVTTRTDGIGTGLGLTMVGEFVRSSGGRVDIQTCLGRGTAVVIRLPGIAPEPCSARAGVHGDEGDGVA